MLLLSFAVVGCSFNDPRYNGETVYLGGFKSRVKEQKRANYDDVSYWDGDRAPGAASVKIVVSQQRAYFYKGGELVGISILSTGREGHDTPTGSYKILQKDIDHKSSLYGDYVDKEGTVIQKDIDTSKDHKPPGAIFDGARMPFFMRITGGVGMHEGFLPGYPASHGCIRMPGFMAQKFFENIAVGSPVVIVP